MREAEKRSFGKSSISRSLLFGISTKVVTIYKIIALLRRKKKVAKAFTFSCF